MLENMLSNVNKDGNEHLGDGFNDENDDEDEDDADDVFSKHKALLKPC